MCNQSESNLVLKAPSKVNLAQEALPDKQSSLGSFSCLNSIAIGYITCHWVLISHCFLARVFIFLNAFPLYLNSKLSNSKNHVLDILIIFLYPCF